MLYTYQTLILEFIAGRFDSIFSWATKIRKLQNILIKHIFMRCLEGIASTLRGSEVY